jgi:hypothetical protein
VKYVINNYYACTELVSIHGISGTRTKREPGTFVSMDLKLISKSRD